MEGYLPVTSRLSLNASISGGVVDGATIPLGNNFKIGGINSDIANNYISFYGYETMRKLASEFMVGQIGLQYRVHNNLYFLIKANILTYTGIEDETVLEDDSIIFEDYKYGYGVTMGYKSLIGPIEVSLTNDADSVNSYIISVDIGYIF
jgi:NTE family protein